MDIPIWILYRSALVTISNKYLDKLDGTWVLKFCWAISLSLPCFCLLSAKLEVFWLGSFSSQWMHHLTIMTCQNHPISVTKVDLCSNLCMNDAQANVSSSNCKCINYFHDKAMHSKEIQMIPQVCMFMY